MKIVITLITIFFLTGCFYEKEALTQTEVNAEIALKKNEGVDITVVPVPAKK